MGLPRLVIKTNTILLLKTSDSLVSYKAGKTIFREGEEGDHMFVIKTGTVELRTGNVVIGTFVSGDIIGEMSLVDQEQRSATATAKTDCELVTVDYPRFQAMIREQPDFAIEVMQTMSMRLRNMNRETNAFHKRAVFTQIQAMTDPLTGAHNRRAWDERMANDELRCKRLGKPATLVSIDLDELKSINDSLGHEQGDVLIRTAAKALFEVCRDSDLVARLGGDEFGVLAFDCTPEAGRVLLKRIEEAFAKYRLHASIGIATRDPISDLKHAWAEADKAMYACKRRHKAEQSSKSLPAVR